MWSSRKASRILPTRKAAPGKGIDSSGDAAAGPGCWRRPMTSTLSAPRRSAGDSGVFWRRPPSQKKRSPTQIAGKRMGSAAEASACSAPMVTDCARTNGSLLQFAAAIERALWRKTTVFPDPMSVAVTDSDSSFPSRMLDPMWLQGMRRRTTRSSCAVCTMPPRWRCPSTSSMCPLPSSVAGARMNSFTPKLTISSSTKLSQRSQRMRPCLSAMSAVAAKKQAWIAPTDVPQMMSNWTCPPRSPARSSRI